MTTAIAETRAIEAQADETLTVETRVNEKRTVERAKLIRAIDMLPDESVTVLLSLVRSMRYDTDDGYFPHIPNAETIAAIRAGRAGEREVVTIEQIMAELNAEN